MTTEHWPMQEVCLCLGDRNFNHCKKCLGSENLIDARVLLSLTENDLKAHPLKISNLGELKRLCQSLEQLKNEKTVKCLRDNGFSEKPSYSVINFEQTPSSLEQLSPCGISPLNSYDKQIPNKKWELDRKRFLLSVLYLFIAQLASGYAVGYAQEHLPDKKLYPPLPDILLDNIPDIPWAFVVTEWVIAVLSFIGITLMFFHKYRFIILQRLFAIAASVYLLRCLCVVSTGIPMPQKVNDCDKLILKNNWERTVHAFKLLATIGLKAGIKTCGDYVYSGHTAIITLLVLAINEYTPRSWTLLHIINWAIGVSGVSCILLGHEHYTLDIVLAIPIAIKLFSIHHILANNLSQITRDKYRIKKYFPVFYFFECNTDGSIPAEFEWPLPSLKRIKNIFQGTILCFKTYYDSKMKQDK